MTELSPIPGNIQIIWNECDRLRTLAWQWEHTGEALRVLRTDGWLGTAAERFADARRERGRYWLIAADCHAKAAEAVQGYLHVLFEVQRLAASAVEQAASDPVRMAAARQSITRWQAQLTDAGRQAATVIRAMNAELATLHGLSWPSLPVRSTGRTPAVSRDSGSHPPQRCDVEPPGPFDVRDPSYRRRLVELNNAVLAYWAHQNRRLGSTS